MSNRLPAIKPDDPAHESGTVTRLFAGALIAMGCVFLFLPVVAIWKQMGTTEWPTTEGKIIHSAMVTRDKNPTKQSSTEFPEVRYTYSIEGKEFTSTRVAYTNITSAEIGLLERFPEGSIHPVHYDPSAPDQSVIDTKVSYHPLAISPIGLGVGGFGLWLLFFRNRK